MIPRIPFCVRICAGGVPLVSFPSVPKLVLVFGLRGEKCLEFPICESVLAVGPFSHNREGMTLDEILSS